LCIKGDDFEKKKENKNKKTNKLEKSSEISLKKGTRENEDINF